MPPSRTTSAAQSSSFSTLSITFLGTASAQPSSTRNHSSLALTLGGRGDIWLFDCGEATQHRVQKSDLKMGKIRKIFLTHTHGDHIFGIGPLICGLMNGAGGLIDGHEDPRLKPSEEVAPFEIYGPLGTRAYVRSILRLTHTKLEGRYVVHELRFPHDPKDGDYTALPPHRCELPGKNLQQEPGSGPIGKSIWPDIYADDLISVSAAPIEHSVSCVGYVVLESPIPLKMDPSQYLPHIKRNNAPFSYLSRLQKGEDITLADGTLLRGISKRPGRKIVILGDTYDPSPITPIAIGADLLVHEATNAYLPDIDPMTKDDETEEIVEDRTRKRGHSTPQMAGRFARSIGARKLALNHFSARYRGDDDVNSEAKVVMNGIKQLAEKTFGGEVVCARDFMTLHVQHAQR